MPEVNQILEAEKTMKGIVGELIKMKKAADLLNSAQEKTDAVLKASESIVSKMDTFVDQSTTIVNKIAKYDIQADLTEMKGIELEIKGSIEKVGSDIKKSADKIILKNKDQMDKFLTELKTFIQQYNEKNEQNYIYILIAVGINIIVVGALVLKSFGII